MHRLLRLAPNRAVATSGTLVGLAALGGGAEGCRGPTQVTVEVGSTGIPCASLKGVSIVVARSPQEAEDRMALGSLSAEVARGVCDGARVGTLVITPQGPRGAILVVARVSDDPGATCKPPEYKGCVVARRSFAFVEHVAVTLPVPLEVACADVPCDVETSCLAGRCATAAAGAAQR